MRVYTRIVVEIGTDKVIDSESYDYIGPVARLFTVGKGGSSKQKSESQSTSESGTQFNEDFLTRALALAGKRGKQTLEAPQGRFDAQRYLAENPDVANSTFASDPYQHYVQYGKAEGRAYPGSEATTEEVNLPDYNPTFVRASYTPGAYTPGSYTAGKYTSVAPEGFNRLEDVLYQRQNARLNTAQAADIARQREELSQAGGLTSPSQYLEGGTRAALDKSYAQQRQQAASDAALARLQAEQGEAARRTQFDVGEAGARTAYDVGQGAARTAYDVGQGAARTAYDVGQAGAETGFNERTAANQLEEFYRMLAAIIEAGRYSKGQQTATGSSSSGGGFNFGLGSSWLAPAGKVAGTP